MPLWGASELKAALDKVAAGADKAAKEIVAKSAAVVIREAQGNFEGSHKRGQPHVGGDKPNIVTGFLRRSIRMTPIVRIGLATYGTQVGPNAIYGRRVELGLAPTRPFPYFMPAVTTARAQFSAIGTETWNKYLRL